MSRNPSFFWERLKDSFYRTFEGYPMTWDTNLDDYIVVSAPYGGCLALYFNPQKIIEYTEIAIKQTFINVYNARGIPMWNITWGFHRIAAVGWTQDEHLIVVTQSGLVRYYYDFNGDFDEFPLGNGEHSVKECKFLSNGFVALLDNSVLILVADCSKPVPQQLAQVNSEIGGWALIEADDLKIAVGIEKSVAIINNGELKDCGFEEGPFVMAATSPNNELVASLSDNGCLWVTSSDFKTKKTSYNTSMTDDCPKQMIWCGNDAVALVWQDEITLVGPDGGSLSLYFDDTVFAFTEVDGMRVVTKEKHDFFTKVPEDVVEIFRLGSVAPSAILRDCVDQLDARSPKADENLSIIGKSRLPGAVDACIEAAALEFEPFWQKRLIRAAAFGKAALDLYSSEKFLSVSKYVRVLNTLRSFDVSLLISYNQFLHSGPMKTIQRLLLRKLHPTALDIVNYLGLPVNVVYVSWACAKIKGASPDTSEPTLLKEILANIQSEPGMSYDQVARTAFQEGRIELAISLISREPSPLKQVYLLLEMGKNELALEKATESCDASLVYPVILRLRKTLTLAKFFRVLSDHPVADKCFEIMCKARNDSILEDFYVQDDRRADLIDLKYVKAVKEFDPESQAALLKEVQSLLNEVSKGSFESKAVSQQARLLLLQQQLETEYEAQFVGKSVSETISQLLQLSQEARASKVKEDFKVPDKRFAWIRLLQLVSRKHWAELSKISFSKKPPVIGFLPYYHEIKKAGNKQLASQFVARCAKLTSQERIQMYLDVDDVRSAIQEAVTAKDTNALNNLKSRAVTPALMSEIENALNR